MPLKLPRLRGRRRKEAAVEGQGDWDTASVASAASRPDVESVYSVRKVKDLPKLHRAVWKGNLEKVRRLTKSVKTSELNSTDKEKRTPLHLACAVGHEAIVFHLCSVARADPNLKDSAGCTPLHRCIQANCPTSCLNTLIETGARVNEADRQGRTPLHVAAERGRTEAAALLQEHGADMEAVEKNGCTALHAAAVSGHKETISQLIRDGADVNKTDGQGCTALMLGAREGHTGVVQALSEAQADPELQDQAGLGATDHALKHNHQDCAQLTEEYRLQWARRSLLHSTAPTNPPHNLTTHPPTLSYSPASTPSQHHSLTEPDGSQPLPEPTADDLWASGSEEGDFPDAPGGIVADGGLGAGGFNLREAMAHAKLSPIKDGDGIRGQSHPDDEPMAQPRPPHQEAVDDIALSDWESEEEVEVKPHPPPNIVNSAHIPVAVGASRESSTLQQNRGRGSKSEEEGESEGVSGDAAGVDNTGATAHVTGLEIPKISDRIEPGHDDKSESILSSESESDLPLFGGYNPSTPQSITRPSLPRLPPVSQGSPQSGALIAAPLPLQSRRQGNSPSPTQTSPTLVTPLSTTGGLSVAYGLSPDHRRLAHMAEREAEPNEQGQTHQRGEEGEKGGEDGEGSDWFMMSDEEEDSEEAGDGEGDGEGEGEGEGEGDGLAGLGGSSVVTANLSLLTSPPARAQQTAATAAAAAVGGGEGTVAASGTHTSPQSMEEAASRRKYERDNEFLLAFQARQQRKALPGIAAQHKAGLNSKSEPVLFPFSHSHTPSPEGCGSCANLSGSSNPESGSKVQQMRDGWERGQPLKIPPLNEPQLISQSVGQESQRKEDSTVQREAERGEDGRIEREHGSVVAGVRETPVSGGRGGTGQVRGGGSHRENDGQGEGRTGERLGEGGEGGGREEGGAEGGGKGGEGGGGGGGGSDDDKGHDRDESEEEDTEEEEEEEEEEEGEMQGVSSTTPLIQTHTTTKRTAPISGSAIASVDLTSLSGRGQALTTPTAISSPPPLAGDQLRVYRSSSQSELWSTDSSSIDIALPPPPHHSTLLISSPAHLTPSHRNYLPLHTAGSGRRVRGDENSSTKPTSTAKSHDIKAKPVDTESKSHDPLPESHDPLSESHDQSSESHDMSELSEIGHWDDPSHSHLSPAHQSLFGSGHPSQLASSLHEVRHSLDRSQRSVRSGEEARRRLQVRLEDTQHRLEETMTAKLALETAKMDQELKMRQASYQLQQEREAVRSGRVMESALREQVQRLEERLAREMEQRQAAELLRREAELQARSHLVLSQQLQDQFSELSSRLQAEKEARAVQEGLYREQLRLFQELQNESTRMQEQKTEVAGQLQAVHSGRQGLEEQLQRLQRENTQLQVELSGERCRSEEVRGRLEGEVGEARERLREKAEKLVTAEDALLASRQQFECDLTEVRGKVDSLSSALDTESSSRRQLETEREQLRAKLEKATLSLQATTRRSAAKEKELGQAIEVQRGKREEAERELAGSRARLDQLTSQYAEVEARLGQAESEGRGHAGQVQKRTNQVAALQKAVEQWQQRVASLEESLTKERATASEASSSLVSRERELGGVQAEVVRLTEQLAGAQRRLEEKEASTHREQGRTDGLLETLREEFDRSKTSLEERCRSLAEEVRGLREERARREGEGKEREQELQRLRAQLDETTKARDEVEGRLRTAQESCEREEARAAENLEEVSSLREALGTAEKEREALGQQLLSLQDSLSHNEERVRELTLQCEEESRRRGEGESEVGKERDRVGELEREAREGRRREESLRAEMQAMAEERTRLRETSTRVQGEALQLREEREALQVAVEVSRRETAEARALWEMEIKSRASVSLRVLDLEKSHQQSAPTIETEKRRARKAQELKKVAESKFESLQQHSSGLEREVGQLRAELRAVRKRLRGVEREAESREGEGVHHEAELSSLKAQLESAQQLLLREAELRTRAEHVASQASQQLETAADRDKELQRLQRANSGLEEEVRRLEQALAHSTAEVRDMAAAMHRTEEEVHLKLTQKLQEVNAHLQQQSLVHSSLQHRTEAELKRQLDSLQSQAAQAKKFKELYENEVGRSERLEERGRLAEQEAEEARAKTRFERSRMQYLLSSSSSHPHPFTSTPHKLNLTGHTPSTTDHLLSSVRSELDRSISKHLASVPRTSTATQPVTQPTSHISSEGRGLTADHVTHPARPSLSTSRHLDSIRRNYHV